MARQHPQLVQRFLDKFSKSRDLSISLVLHVIIVLFFGAFVVIKVVPPPPPDIQGGLLEKQDIALKPIDRISKPVDAATDIPITPHDATANSLVTGLQTLIGGSQEIPISEGLPLPVPVAPAGLVKPAVPGDIVNAARLDPATKRAIDDFTKPWRVKAGRNGSTKGEFQFTAYIGQYSGGNWNSTVRISNGKVETGSLPNLLYLMSFWTKDRVQTNYKNVQAIRLDSDELFVVKPPFIFLTGTRDFSLTEKEVGNLRKYVQLGGCVWGDSSVPGERSQFDIAFRREMGRVMGTADQKFEPLPESHPIFSNGYFSEVKGVAKGLNNYRLPVLAMKYLGEVAIIYTANDYGDMWQVGLNNEGKVDLRKDLQNRYVAVNRNIYEQRDVYVRNLNPEALVTSYKFGANIVMHLLTRWESRVSSSAL